MKVVVFSYYSPWSSSVGSRRIGGVVAALAREGHDVTVIGSAPPDGNRAAVDGVAVIETHPTDRVLAARAALGRVSRRTAKSTAGSTSDRSPDASMPPAAGETSSASSLRHNARLWVGFPDTMWEWTYTATRAARDLAPDLVIATAPPMAALHAASRLARSAGCPWIADMRDLWTGDPNRQVPPILRRLDRRLEHRVLASAAAITTVAVSLADQLRAQFPDTPVTTLRNGFDTAWLRLDDVPPTRPPSIVYTGTLTANTGRRVDQLCDVAAELRTLDHTATIEIYGAVDSSVPRTIAARRLGGTIRLHGVVSGERIRAAQHGASALLNLSWESELDYTNLPAKLFEYAAARRPVIHLGSIETLGTELIRDHQLGFITDPAQPAAAARVVADVVSGALHWAPPTPDALGPLSQAHLVDGFRRVVADATG